MRHPAHEYTYKDLYKALEAEVAAGNVIRQHGDDNLVLYCYSKSCVYDHAWNNINMLARGLVLDTLREEIVATPFPKFFNLGERTNTVPNQSFEVFEKVDGSLIICFYHNGDWKTATKGSFKSEQAQWAHKQIQPFKHLLRLGITYLFEGLYRENRIVIDYDYEGLVLLAAYNSFGEEAAYNELITVAQHFGCRITKRYSYASISELLSAAETLPATEEGWVLRFEDGTRLKIKGAEYRRIHALISDLTPLGIWKAMKDQVYLDDLRKEIPEEFWVDFDTIVQILKSHYVNLIKRILSLVEKTAHLSDKDLGLTLTNYPDPERNFLFPLRKAVSFEEFLYGRSREAFFKIFRPTGNKLEGYRASYAVTRVQDEAL